MVTARPRQNEDMPATDTDELAAILADALSETGRKIGDLTVTEAIDLAEGLRGFVAVLPTPSAFDKRLAADLIAAADLIERRAGTGWHHRTP
jgi:hypothetical protein